MKVVYIAGKFRGPTPWDVAENVRNAERYALAVAKLGAMPLCPHSNTQHFDGQCTEHFWLDGTLELLKRCDAMVVVPGWGKSQGTIGEIEYCRWVGKPVFYPSYAETDQYSSAWIEFRTWLRGEAECPTARP